jgi:hypothetical protein
MSMFIVSREHIDHIVTAIIRAELMADTPDNIGRMLWNENLESAKYRYPNDGDGERPGPVDFRDSDVDTYTWTERPELDRAVLRNTVASYDYQACEHPEWKTSQACAVVSKLLDGLGPNDSSTREGWDW